MFVQCSRMRLLSSLCVTFFSVFHQCSQILVVPNTALLQVLHCDKSIIWINVPQFHCTIVKHKCDGLNLTIIISLYEYLTIFASWYLGVFSSCSRSKQLQLA